MKISEAKAIAAKPAEHCGKLIVARLKLQNAALRSFPSSPRQMQIRELIANIEKMPRHLWIYNP
jgi:hypothetical protein